jgi:hypothetical protein
MQPWIKTYGIAPFLDIFSEKAHPAETLCHRVIRSVVAA